MEWYWILLIVIGTCILIFILSIFLYRQFFKRFYDLLFSFIAIILLSPLFLVLTIVGAIMMHGKPYFVQERPGRNEKIFKLIKFRSMNNKKDKNGYLLPDAKRLNKYGKFLRKTSLDEIPELFNIFIGNMSIVGPRPLLVTYLPYYKQNERKRHDIRPGLTGYTQVHGRNFLEWEERFKYDLYYVKHFSLFLDLHIIFMTFIIVFKKKNVVDATQVLEDVDGNKYVIINGEKRYYPKSLDVERSNKI